MPAKCHFCETNTHSDIDKEQYPVCERVFLTKNEAWSLIGDTRSPTIHVMMNPKENMLVGVDWERNRVKCLIQDCEYIEMTDPKGYAREHGHGLAVMYNGWHHFVETPEAALKAYEELFLNEKSSLNTITETK